MPPARRLKPRSPTLAALGEAMRLTREKRGMSQQELAEAVGTHHKQVGGIERGLRNPTYETLMRIASSLESSVGEITTLADDLLRKRRR
jgi:transcriptional regulator with XRE-family HTH domain